MRRPRNKSRRQGEEYLDVEVGTGGGEEGGVGVEVEGEDRLRAVPVDLNRSSLHYSPPLKEDQEVEDEEKEDDDDDDGASFVPSWSPFTFWRENGIDCPSIEKNTKH